MSDTEREAFDPDGFDESGLSPCPFCGSANVSLSEGSKGDKPWYYVECEDCSSMAEPEVWNRRSTTTEARAPLSDEQIGDLWEASALDAGSGVRRSVRFARSVIAARAPAPPSDVQVDVKGGGPKKSWPVERVIEHLNKSARLIGPGGMYGMTQAELRDIAGRLADEKGNS